MVMSNPKTVSGHRLRMASAAADMTFTDIARAMGIQPTTFSAKLHGHRRWLSGELEQLAILVGVPAVWLAGTGPDVPR
jgi:transcriptional regulator with XRE-family HTH domain